MTDPKTLQTTAQTAAALGITTNAVAQQVRRGVLIPAYKLPGLRGAYLFNPQAVAA
jgi:hypothetical protein